MGHAEALVGNQDPAKLSTDPYLQLEKHYNRFGDEAKAGEMYRKVRHNARKKIRLGFKEPRARGENARAENSHAQWSRRRHLSERILDGLTGYGVRTKRLFAIALLIVSFGMLMFGLDNGLDVRSRGEVVG
jgi:hypothetical protein